MTASSLARSGTGRFQVRLSLAISLVILMVMGGAASYMMGELARTIEDSARTRAAEITRGFAVLGAAAGLDNLERVQQGMGTYADDAEVVHVEIVDTSHVIVAAEDASRVGMPVDDPQWATLVAAEREHLRQAEGSGEAPVLVIAQPIREQGEVRAWVRIEFSLAEARRQQAAAMWRLGSVTMALLATGLLVGVVPVRRLSAVLQGTADQLRDTVAELGSDVVTKDDTAHVPPPARGALERLVHEVSGSIRLLRSQATALRSMNDALAQRVAEQTNEVVAMNQALQRERDRIRMIIDHALDAIVVIDDRGHVRHWNPQAETIFGWTGQDMIGRPLTETLISPQHRATLQQQLLSPPGSGPGPLLNRRVELSAFNTLGREFPVEVTVVPLYDEGGHSHCAFIRDITERQEVQTRLVHLASFPEQNPNLVIETDLRGNVRYINPAAKLWFDQHGAAATRALLEQDFVSLAREIMGTSSTWMTREIDVGNAVLEQRVAYLREQGLIRLYASDVTERKHAEAMIEHAAGDLERKNRQLEEARDSALAAAQAKSQFLANMSHEIRTPMNGVIGMARILERTKLTTDQQEYVRVIRNCGQSLLGVIDDILDFSKIEAGKLALVPIDFDLRTSVEEIVQQFADQAHRKGIELLCLFEIGVPTAVRGDAGRIRQVLNNLIGNAVKFTSQGEVVLRVACAGSPDGERAEIAIRFSVSDTGIGITPEDQARLFQSFSQVDGSLAREFGGSGLGLAISKQLVEMMGGRIQCESTVGKGSTFSFVVSLPPAASVPSSYAKGCASIKGLRVCVADPNETLRLVLKDYLEGWQVEALPADSGASVLQVLEQARADGRPVDVAVVDADLPDMDGYTLGQTIRRSSTLAGVRLVLLTAFGQRGDGEKAKQSGFSAYLTKPIRQSHLYDCLALLMGHPVTVQAGSERRADPARGEAGLITRHTLEEARTQLRLRILVAEDNPVNQQVAALSLRELGCLVDVAANGREAIEAVQRNRYDLIMMDCQMPKMDGFSATREIRRLESDRALPTDPAPSLVQRMPIIALTAHAMQGDREECLTAGMDDYVKKPFTEEDLRAVIDRWLPSGRSVVAREADARPPAAPERDGGGPTRDPLPALDPAALEGVRAIERRGRPGLALRLMVVFLRDSQDVMEQLGEAVEQGHFAVIDYGAHRLKSSSATIGATRLSALFLELEGSAKREDLDEVREAFARVGREYQQVCREIDRQVGAETTS